jgi:hypothetical protein
VKFSSKLYQVGLGLPHSKKFLMPFLSSTLAGSKDILTIDLAKRACYIQMWLLG